MYKILLYFIVKEESFLFDDNALVIFGRVVQGWVHGWILGNIWVDWNDTLVGWMKSLKQLEEIIWLFFSRWILMNTFKAMWWSASKDSEQKITFNIIYWRNSWELMGWTLRNLATFAKVKEKYLWRSMYKDVVHVVNYVRLVICIQIYDMWMDYIMHIHCQCIMYR